MANRFWANSNAEAKRKFRFLLTVQKSGLGSGDSNTIEKWLIQKVTRPSFQISEATHSYLNHTFYYPGRLTWQDVSFTLVDALYPDTCGLVMGMLEQSGYRLPASGDTNAQTISKDNSKITMKISSIDAKGDELDEWSLENAWILSSNFGEYDYTADDLMSIDVTVKYDYATYKILQSDRSVDGLNKISGLGKAGGTA